MIGGLLAGGVAYGLTAGAGTAPRKSEPAAAAHGGSGNGNGVGSGNADERAPAAGSRPPAKLTLPDSFMGLIRNDDDAGAQSVRESLVTKNPSMHATATVYEDDEGSDNAIIVSALDADGTTSDEDARQFMAQQWLPTDSAYINTVHGPISTFDPGPFGGILQCAQSSVRTDATDVWGNHINNSVQCMWADANTYVNLIISPGVSGDSVARGAAVARKFRDTIESWR
ncbi:hypothetical protein ACFV06_26815 [Streptomyces sp. NPDC059618]|uniref:hypothetical protein n=1 Tax=Streptomyces sp. NPDC059618 TaxID=3346887 RepID=UPI003673F4F0